MSQGDLPAHDGQVALARDTARQQRRVFSTCRLTATWLCASLYSPAHA